MRDAARPPAPSGEALTGRHGLAPAPWRAWLAGAVAVGLSATFATLLVRSWAADWADFGFVGHWNRLQVALWWALLVAGGTALLYLIGWIAFPCLPPHDYVGGLGNRERRRDRLLGVPVLGVVVTLLVIAASLYGAWSTLHPCEGLNRCVTLGDPVTETAAAESPNGPTIRAP